MDGKEKFIRNKLNDLEKHHEYSVATDTVRCWLDEYNEAVEKSTRISNPDFYYSTDELEEEDEDF